MKTKTKKEKFYDYKKSYEITGVIVTQHEKLKLPNRQHKKLYEYRQLLLSELNPCEKDKISKSIQGLESQLKQI